MTPSSRPRRGIYLLPTLFTIGNLFCGYASVVQSSLGRLEQAALLIILAAVLDGLDGRIARLTGTQSDFGLEFDSLADITSFGLAPALLAHAWVLGPSRIGWTVAFLYVVCVATRLARYNIQKPGADKRYFVGLPSPMAGCVLGCIVFAFPEPSGSTALGAGLALLVLVLAILMISRLRYRSFREINLRDRRSYVWVLPMALILIAIAVEPKLMLLLVATAYLLSAPSVYLWGLARRSGTRATADGEAAGVAEIVDGPATR